MSKTTLVNLNGSGGAFTSISSTIPAKRVEIREDESVTPQGLQYQKADDGFTQTYQCGTPGSPDQPQIALGDIVANLGGRGRPLGYPAQSGAGGTVAAAVYIKLKSATVTTTKVRVTEYE